jgi:hypothetical protein
MISAFGIEHGDSIEKVRMPRLPRGGPTRAQKRTQAPPGAPSGPKRLAGKLNQIGSADISLKRIGSGAGKGIKGVGAFMERNPGVTGTALVGGGGYAGYKLSRKDRK